MHNSSKWNNIVVPYISNLGKRLVKSPEVYISDSGIAAALLGLRNFEELSGHPAFGAIWEQIALSNLKGLYPNAEFFLSEIKFTVDRGIWHNKNVFEGKL